MIFQDPFASLNPAHRPVPPDPVVADPRQRRQDGRRPGEGLHGLLKRVQLTPPSATWTSSRTSCRRPAPAGGDRPRPRAPTRRRCWPTSRCRCSTCRSGSACSTCCGTCATAEPRDPLHHPRHRSARTSPTTPSSCTPGRMVEGGDSETVTQHRPTRTPNCSSTPRPTPTGSAPTRPPAADRGGRRAAEPDQPPDGCRFHPRCPHVMDRCRTELPPRLEIVDAPGHWAPAGSTPRAHRGRSGPAAARPNGGPADEVPPATHRLLSVHRLAAR